MFVHFEYIHVRYNDKINILMRIIYGNSYCMHTMYRSHPYFSLTQMLPTAQRLLDQLLSSEPNAINSVCGAPDPTAGASANESTAWWLDEALLRDNIRKTLLKFCVPSPVVLSDVNYLNSSSAPPAASEWQSLLRPLRGREPEGLWNLLQIVRELCRRADSNSGLLLRILTDELLTCDQVLMWWFQTRVYMHASAVARILSSTPTPSTSGVSGGGSTGAAPPRPAHPSASINLQLNLNLNLTLNASTSSNCITQFAAANLCEELVSLWKIVVLSPFLSGAERFALADQLKHFSIHILDRLKRVRITINMQNGHRPPHSVQPQQLALSQVPDKTLLLIFPGTSTSTSTIFVEN